jgi:hypothetical protein
LANLNYLGRKEEVIGIKLGELHGNFKFGNLGNLGNSDSFAYHLGIRGGLKKGHFNYLS